MNDPCEVWLSLSDRAALDEPLCAEELAFLARHPTGCSVCAREQAVWDGMSALLEPTAPASVAAPLPAQPDSIGRPLRWRISAAYAAAVVLLALGGTLVVRGASSTPATHSTEETADRVASGPPLSPRVFLSAARTSQVEVDSAPALDGAQLRAGAVVFARTGSACLSVEPGVRACLAQGSRVRVARLGAVARRLELLEGKLAASLSPQPAGTSFGITTSQGTAIAVGTAYSVEVPAGGGPVVTRVLHGTVLVRGSSGQERRVTAHHMVVMNGEPSALPGADEAHERRLLEREDSAASQAPLPAGVVQQDAREVAIQSPPAHSAPVQTLRDSRATPVANATRHARDAQLVPSATQLLLVAREGRARADTEAALAAYRELFARHAASPEAHAVRVPYGELLLATGSARAALAAFQHYLVRGGPLAEEACFGRIRALRALRQTEDERAALRDFLATYTSSPLNTSLRARLGTLAP